MSGEGVAYCASSMRNGVKQNLYSPGYNIPIVSIDILNKEKCDYLIILSWNFLDDILLKIDEYRKRGLRIIVPFPHIQII